VIHVDFLPHGVTINAQYYSNFLRNDVHQAIQEKILEKLAKNMILLYVATMDWEIANYPPYSPNLAPTDLHLFGPMKVHLGEQKFETEDEIECGVLNWLRSQYKTFYADGISN
jgi:histone-lysine N-methyltransferase SETMAR